MRTRDAIETDRPEIVNQEVKDAQDDNEHDGAKLGLEAYHYHDTSNEAEKGHNHSPDTPSSAEDKSSKEEDEQNSACELEVHLAVFLVDRREASESLGFPNPGIRQDHQQATHNRQVSEEEIDVEDESISKCLGNNNTSESSHSVIRVFAGNDESRAGAHGNNVANQEEVSNAIGNCRFTS